MHVTTLNLEEAIKLKKSKYGLERGKELKKMM